HGCSRDGREAARGVAEPRLFAVQRPRTAALPARAPPLHARSVGGDGARALRRGVGVTDDSRLDAPPRFPARLLTHLASLIFPLRGDRPRLQELRRVLVVRPDDRVGNALLTVPLALALRDALPAARIDLLLARRRASVADGLPGVRVVRVEKTDAFRHPLRFVRFLRALRSAGYDAVID